MEVRLEAETRAGTGKGVARKLRAAGKVPGILYGRGLTPVALAVEARELSQALHTDAGRNVLIDLQVGGEEHLAMIRELQRDAVRGAFFHVDFVKIARDVAIEVDVPIHVVGESHGVKEGGVIEHHLWNVRVECLPGNVPERIDADVTEIGIGEVVRVGALSVPEGVSILTDAGEIVVSVVVPQKPEELLAAPEEAAVAAEGEEAAAPAEGAPPAEGGEES